MLQLHPEIPDSVAHTYGLPNEEFRSLANHRKVSLFRVQPESSTSTVELDTP